MPIKGLTDRESLAPRFPRLGKLKKGAPKTGQGFPKDLDYFRFATEQPEVMAAFVGAYGDTPTRLGIYLPYTKAEENFDTWMEEWSAGGLVHRCDGETMTVYQKGKSYDYDPKPCPYANGKQERTKKNPGCKIVGRLSVVLPDLITAGFVGYVVLETHSNHDVRNIMAALMEVERHRPQGLQGIPFTIRRQFEKISTPDGNGGRARRKKSLIQIVPDPVWIQSRLSLDRAEAFKALPRGDDVDYVIDAEYNAAELVADENGVIIVGETEAEVQPEIEMDPLWAAGILTPKGTPFGDLNADQLQVVIDSTPDGSDRNIAAKMLIDIMIDEQKEEADALEQESVDAEEISDSQAAFDEMTGG